MTTNSSSKAGKKSPSGTKKRGRDVMNRTTVGPPPAPSAAFSSSSPGGFVPSKKPFKKVSREALAWPNRLPQVGDQVAAKVASHDLWILTTVVGYNPATEIYEVIDDDDPTEKRHFFLQRWQVVNMARPGEATGTGWQVGERVLAMYPDTTSFYIAAVSARPYQKGPAATGGGSKGRALLDTCVIQFDGDEDESGTLPDRHIPARFVCYMPPRRGGSSSG